ncbi:MAG: hypothetical protein HOP28_01200 [Gemmatimonadales bacterium]|nr:hypothetical protein [Gemmatimonadales bacterium]
MPTLRPFAASLLLLAACGSDHTAPSSPLAGRYTATVFRVTPTGQGEIDVLAAGGTLSITISVTNGTTGLLTVPAALTGAGDFSASMAGSAAILSGGVRFQQTEETFVRDLTWTHNGTSLSVTDQVLLTASYTLVLTKQ